MILAQSGQTYPINRNGVDATVDKSVDDIMTYVSGLGYNSFLLVNATYNFATQYYIILPFDATLVNGDSIYLLDNPTGVSIDPTTGAKVDRVRNYKYNVNNDGNIQQAGSISWSTGTYYGDTYRTYPYRTYEPVFYTTLEYSHIYVNNEDVTPVLYAWRSATAIAGKDGVLALPMLYDEYPGDPVTDLTSADFARIPEEALLSRLYPEKIFGEEKTIAYSGEDNYVTVTWSTTTYFTMRYYSGETMIGSVSYSLAHAGDDVYMHMAVEFAGGEQGTDYFARPCLIIRDQDTGLISAFTESVDASLYETYYAWLQGSLLEDWTDAIWGDWNKEAGGDDYTIPSDDPIPEPTLPTISSLELGFTRMYKVTKDQINDFWDWLANEDEQLINYLFKADPLSGVIGVNIVPFAVEAADTATEIKYLGLSSGVNGNRITKQFQEIDCGTFAVPKYMHGTYLDHSPFTKIKCIIPYIGTIDLDTDDVSGKTLHLKLRFDVLTGICTAHLYVNNSLHYEASGNININVAITQKDYSSLANAVKGVTSRLGQNITQGMAVGAMTGGMAGAGVGIAGSMVASGLDIAMSKPTYRYVQGGAGASAAFMGIDRPFLLFEIPKLARPKNDERYIGMPSYITDTIGSFKGFSKYKNPHIDNVQCTAKEKLDIEAQLANGIINQTGTDSESATPDATPVTAGNTVITFLKNKSDNNVMGKTFSTTQLKIEGKLLFNNSITTPVFLIKGNIVDYNYAYIAEFNRFYYISDVIVQTNGMCEVHFNADPLQSFKDSIKDCKGICERSQKRNNMYINDGALITQQDSNVFTKQFSKDNVHFSFTKSNACFTLILADI